MRSRFGNVFAHLTGCIPLSFPTPHPRHILSPAKSSQSSSSWLQNVSRPFHKTSDGRKKCRHRRLGQHSQNRSEERIHLYVYESRKAGDGIIFSSIGLVSSAVDEYVVSSLLEASLAYSRATWCVLSSRANSYAPTLAG
jgi:hypothetical protein